MHQLPASTREASRTTGSARIRTTVSMEPLYPRDEVGTLPGRGGLMTLAFPIAALGTFVVVGLGSLAVAALALAHVVAPWGVFFFYALPALVFFGWTVVELAPARAHHCRLLLRPRRPAACPPERRAAPAPAPSLDEPNGDRVLMRQLMRMWLVCMRPVMDAWRAPRVRRCVNAGFGIGGLATAALVVHNLYSEPWPF